MTFVSRAAGFIRSCATGLPGEYRFCRDGLVSLYASCFAALARHTTGDLDGLGPDERAAWCAFLNSWQDAETGYFLGPELVPDERTRPEMDESYVRMHLAVHVLPALEIMGGAPAYPLRFARRFADAGTLRRWLDARDWRQAWLEGNNLLFAGQLLVHLRDHEKEPAAQPALDLYFDWLDARQDPATGLWGTNGYCDLNDALYGGYHQLLVYFFCGRPVRYAAEIIDAVLSLQQADGSFSHTPGGGACEDVDAVHVLVNLAQRTGYRLTDVRRALSRTVPHLLSQQAPDGGFVYRWGRSYMQSGLLRTFVPADQPDLFSTWFRLHTLGLIAQMVEEPELKGVGWRFNSACSMGWHGAGSAVPETPTTRTKRPGSLRRPAKRRSPIRYAFERAARGAMARVPEAWGRAWIMALMRHLGRRQAPGDRIAFLVSLDSELDRIGREAARQLGDGLDARFWGSQAYRVVLSHLRPGMRLLHLGCGTGSLSYTLASTAGAHVTATDQERSVVAAAAERYHHPRLAFVPAPAIVPLADHPDIILCTDLLDGKPAWDAWGVVWAQYERGAVLAQLTPHPTSWREAAPALAASSASLSGPGIAPAGWSVLSIQTMAGTSFGHFWVGSAS